MEYYTWNKAIPVFLVMLSVASFQIMAVAAQKSSRRYKPLQDTSRPLKGTEKGPTYGIVSIRDDDVYIGSDSSSSSDSDDESIEVKENSRLLSTEFEFKDGRGHGHSYHGPGSQRRSKDKHRRRNKNQDRDRKRMISNGDERDSKRTAPAEAPVSNNAKMYPRTPVILPIVTPEMVEESESEYDKVISTQKQPFHFHIPIVKEHEASAEKSKKWDELEAEAKKYKSQLNFDKEAILASVTDVPMMSAVAGRSAAWTRMVRDSPVLDFLNLAVVLGHEQDEADVAGSKRAVVHLQPTDEVLQELVGDEDDLLSIHSARKDLKSNHHTNKIRKKRGLFSWIKSKLGFGKKSTTTTTTTTRKPRPPPPVSHSESDEPVMIRVTEDNKLKMRKPKKKQKYFKLQTDSQGDTEVDSLLPPALRRSYYYKNVKNWDDKGDDHDDYDNDEENQKDHESKEAPKEKVNADKKSRRRKPTDKHSSSEEK